jgi:hypothetical protein
VRLNLAKQATVFGILVALAVATRLALIMPNFHAVTAAALFAGFYFRSRTAAACVPLLAMFVSDYFLGGYSRLVMASVYGSLLVPLACRGLLRDRLTAGRVATGAVAAACCFFVLTNAAVWYAWYPHTAEALARCYTVALPFFLNALCGDLLFSGLIFGSYVLISSLAPRAEVRGALAAA